MATIGRLSVDLEARTSQFTAGMERARRTNQAFTASATGATMNLTKLRGSMTTLAVALSGATGATASLGRFGSVLGGLALGGGPILAVVAVLGLLGLAYNKMTKGAREATEAAKKFATEQIKAAKLRADPNTEINAGIAAAEAEKRVLLARLDARTTSLQGLGLAGLPDHKTKQLLADIAEQQAAIDAGKGALADSSVKLVAALAREVAVLELSEDAVKRLEIANSILDPSLRKAALSFHDQRVALEKQKKAQEEAAKAAEKHADAMEKLLAEQHRWRVENAKGHGNFTQGMGGTGLPVPVGGLLAGPSAGQITDSRSRRIMEKLAKDAELYRQTWENAIRGVQDSFADMFEQIGRDGFRLVSVLENAARAVQRAFAEMAAAWLTNAIFSQISPGGSPGAARGNATQSMSPSISRAPTASTQVVQNITFNAGFVDGQSGAAWLRANKAVIAGTVAEAASEAPQFARHIVAQGSRR